MSTPISNSNSNKNADTLIEQVSLDFVKQQIIENMFLKFNGSRPHLQERLENAFKERYGYPIPDVKNVRAVYTEGLPGHGKTTIHREAAREFAKLMEMTFINEPNQADMVNGKINQNAFVFTVMTVAGATSKHEIGGLMAKMKINNTEFMGHLPDWKLAAGMMGGLGYAFFDDFTTASYQVQNASFDLLLGGSSGDLNLKQWNAASNVRIEDGKLTGDYDPEKAAATEKMNEGKSREEASPMQIGLAGNRGISDGNKIFPRTSALTNRVQIFDVFDTAVNHSKRDNERYKDELGDAGYGTYLTSNSDMFSINPKSEHGNIPAFPSPRSHDALLDKVRVIIMKNGGLSNISSNSALQLDVITEIERVAASLIGRQISPTNPIDGKSIVYPAQSVSGFYTEMFIGAFPKAEELIKRGVLDQEFIKNKYNNGNDGPGQTFGYQFANSIAQLAAYEISEILGKEKLSKDKMIDRIKDENNPLSLKVREVLSRMSQGMCMLQKSYVSFCIDKFNNRLGTLYPDLYGGKTYKVPDPLSMRTMMFGLIKDNKVNFDPQLGQTFADALTQSYNLMGSFSNFQDSNIKKHLKETKDAMLDAAKSAAAKI